MDKDQSLAAPADAPMTAGNNIGSLVQNAVAAGIDPEGLKQLLDMQERIQAHHARIAFSEGMAKVQANIPAIPYDRHNSQTRSDYATLGTINKLLQPVYTDAGFSLTFGTDDSPLTDHVRITCDVRHIGGHEVRHHVDLPLDMVGIKGQANKTRMHGTGSTLTYGQRYLTCLIFNVTTGRDDDGNAGAALDDTPIDEAQLSTLLDNLADVEADIGAFCRAYQIEDVSDLPARLYDDAMRKLEQKRRRAASE